MFCYEAGFRSLLLSSGVVFYITRCVCHKKAPEGPLTHDSPRGSSFAGAVLQAHDWFLATKFHGDIHENITFQMIPANAF